MELKTWWYSFSITSIFYLPWEKFLAPKWMQALDSIFPKLSEVPSQSIQIIQSTSFSSISYELKALWLLDPVGYIRNTSMNKWSTPFKLLLHRRWREVGYVNRHSYHHWASGDEGCRRDGLSCGHLAEVSGLVCIQLPSPSRPLHKGPYNLMGRSGWFWVLGCKPGWKSFLQLKQCLVQIFWYSLPP